jgi:CRP-like cAMP-binding protein
MQQDLRAPVFTALGPARDRRLLERVVSGLPGFRQLAQHDLADVLAHAWLREARRGEAIASRGAPIPGLIAHGSGSAKLALRRSDGEERILRLLGAGASFGLAAVLRDRPCPVDVVALSTSMVAVVPPMPVQRLAERDARFAHAVTRALAERFLDLMAELQSAEQRSALERLAGYLDALSEPAAQTGAWIARLPATKTIVAARLGVKKETLSRLLHALAARGVVEVRGRDVAILDRPGLAALAGGEG